MKNKYGHTRGCLYCGNEFVTKPRFLDYCSVPCKNPINRPGNIAWNKGKTLTENQKSKQNISGLKKGHGWNKGLPNEVARKRFLENIKCVNNVFIFNSDEELENLIKKLKIDFMIVGEEYKYKKVIGSQYSKNLFFFKNVFIFNKTNLMII
jgi:hypothetical protein